MIGVKLGWRVSVAFTVAIPGAALEQLRTRLALGGAELFMGLGFRYCNGRLVGIFVRMLFCVLSSSYDLHVQHMLRGMHQWPEVGLL